MCGKKRGPPMKFTDAKAIAACIFLSIGWVSISKAPAHATDIFPQDPLFEVKFDPGSVHFEDVTTSILATCQNIESANWTRRSWLFAKASGTQGEVVVIGGLFISKRADDPPIADKSGAIIRFEKDRCALIGPASEVFQRPQDYGDVLSQEYMESLAKDAAIRYQRAFGGWAQFNSVAKRQHKSLQSSKSPLLIRVIREMSFR